MSRANKPPFPWTRLAHGMGFSPRRATRPFARHEKNPPGSKLIRQLYKRATGKSSNRASQRDAASWYHGLREKFPNMKYPLGDRRNKVDA